jgi:hypothetical protein
MEDKFNEFGMSIICPHDYMVSLGIREMDLSKLKEIKDDEELR